MILEHIATNFYTVLVFGVVLLTILWLWRPKRGNLPPGPPSVPILGSMPFLRGKNSEESYAVMRKKYGDIVYLRLFGKPAVIISGYDVIKEALQMKAFSNRPVNDIFLEISKNHGLIQCNGQRWREQRRFTMSALRDFGMGKLSLEGRIMDIVKVLMSFIESKQGMAFDPHDIIMKCVSNIICAIVFGEHFALDDPKFGRFLHYFNRNVRNVARIGLAGFFPFLRYVPGDPCKYHQTLDSVAELEGFLEEKVAEHRKNYNLNNITDFIFAFLKETEQRKSDSNSTFTDLQLIKLISDLFLAGSETTTTTLKWALYYLIQNPDIQAKVQQELDEIVCGDALPSLIDQAQLPYTQACILEIQRCGNIAPFSVPHSTSSDILLRGYLIPEGSMVIPSLTSIFNDSNYFPEPDKFDPGHFLDESNKVKKIEQFIPFGTGQRACPGESLAKMEIFLFLASLLKTYTFTTPEDKQLPNADRYDGIAISPPRFELCAIKRAKRAS